MDCLGSDLSSLARRWLLFEVDLAHDCGKAEGWEGGRVRPGIFSVDSQGSHDLSTFYVKQLLDSIDAFNAYHNSSSLKMSFSV